MSTPSTSTVRSRGRRVSATLRLLTLPFLWERFDLSQPIPQPSGELEYLPRIKSVHVWWRSSPSEQETVALVDFLNSLPNLSGLQIARYHDTPWHGFAPDFGFASPPNVTALSISNPLHTILAAFPNLKTLACPAMFFDSPVLGAAKICLPHLEALIGLRFLSDHDHETLAQDFPHLRVLAVTSIQTSNVLAVFSRFRAFNNLTELSTFRGKTTPLSLGELIAGGRDVLRASHSRGPKLLRVWKDDEAGP
ncbi:hypothetical protein B0H16DRAFT_1730818 [Mycena metata]|uniref:Uncharacterized protein n=1 Tax=Mycena metata TaxID=1033252 RepID=A0AAD7MXL2_9AGAR|nr:hypothetical protein B0H16DRAFT_1730818 [Mycena metata]